MNENTVIVIGGGHAGTEAALAAARAGAQVLLLTQNIETVGQMSCNPAVGGIGKSHLVREIDALGGAMALAADEAGIQFRRLNTSRGAAVRATRAQCDRNLYKAAVNRHLQANANVRVVQQTVADLLVEGGVVCGVKTTELQVFRAAAVVLTAGTFLNGVMHVGGDKTSGGRADCAASTALASRLAELNLPVGRLKTGTPPRLDGRTIDFSNLQRQPGDAPPPLLSFMSGGTKRAQQVCCHISATTAVTHDLIRTNLQLSPIFSGDIQSTGPRYCPSIEDKVFRFADRDSHRVFLEPEGLDVDEYYPNGISTSLPQSVQQMFIRTIPGLENAAITRFGYAIEYDYFDPRALLPSLQTRQLPGLFFAGQINGTTGYEEAAAQGLVAGLNAARLARQLPPWIPAREESYIGVMLDDLTARGVLEPYRMFTSRAECRLSLREDNADLRLTEKGRELCLVDDARWQIFCQRRQRLDDEEQRLNKLKMRDIAPRFPAGVSATQWLRRGDAAYADLAAAAVLCDAADVGEMEARIKYAGYIAHQAAQRGGAEEMLSIPPDFDFLSIGGLSTEVRELLDKHHPASILQAQRISGMTPAAVSLLALSLKKRGAAH